MTDPNATELIAARPALRMHARDGLLFGDVPLAAVAAAHGTPTWVYDASTLRTRARKLTQVFAGVSIHYALKANDHLAVLRILADAGLGADIVSAGEMMRADKAGFAAARTVFSGVGKTRADLEMAVARGLGQINVESPEELAALSAVGVATGRRAPVALRVNPDVDAGTHDKISTGRKGDKFGIPIDDVFALYRHAASLPGIDMNGLAVHIGSQIFTMEPYRAAYEKLASLIRALRADGQTVRAMDCGGGLAVPYRNEPAPLPEAWAATIRHTFGGLGLSLAIEPGRWIAAPSGILLARVIRTRRQGMARPLHILDAAMNDFMRPAMYGAWHGVVPVSPVALHAAPEVADVAGPVCESSDFLARQRLLPPLADDDLVAILDAGAYGAVMSSSYNARPAAAQVMVDQGEVALIRPRGRLEALWKEEKGPGCGPNE